MVYAFRQPATGAAHKRFCSFQTTRPATMVATARPLSFQPKNGLFDDLLAVSPRSKIHSRSGSKTVTSASAPTAERAFFQIQQPRRIDRVFGDQIGQRNAFGVDQLHERQRQFGFQTGDAERRVIEFHFLLVIAVRRVVAAQNFNRAVGQPFQNRLAVARGAQRRIHFEIRVVGRPFREVAS